MNPTEDIFHAVLALPVAEREAALEQRCSGDAALLAEIASLIEASEAEELLGRHHAEQARRGADTGGRGRMLGPYRTERLLGRGGMGAVYLAERADGEFEQRVAIKVVDLPLATELFRERFRLERQILAGLVHPYIARLLDGGVSVDGEQYLVMEYVDGVSITHYCDQQRLGLRARLALFGEVCSAVQLAHQNLVVHRDLKPDNILVAADGTPRLLDFGTAKLLAPLPVDAAGGFTQHGLQSFTPQYASPEQVLGDPITIATDTYSLGVLLYVLITGVPPYVMTEFTTGEMLRVICTEQPAKPSAAAVSAGLGFAIDQDLDAIVGMAMRKEPQHRYRTVDQFVADIERWLTGLPVHARRGNWRYRTGKFIRRNKLSLAVAALLVFSIVAGLVGTLWQAHVANAHRERAEARSEDLRQLSNSLLSEIDEAIKNLPGSTEVQHLLVNRVLEHLDRMSRDSGGERSTSLDLINAYTRLGDIQGNPYDQNIGDAPGALVSLDKAVAIAQTLKAAVPNDAEVLESLALAEQSRGEVLFGIGRTPEALVSMRSAVSAFNMRIAAGAAGAADFAAAASATAGLGDQLGQTGVASLSDSALAMAAYREALRLSEQALAVDPGFVRSQRGVAIDHLKIGNILAQTNPVSAIDEYRRAFAAWDALSTADKEAVPTLRIRAMTTMKLALALSESRDYAGAIAAFEQTRGTYESLAAADATDTRAQYDLAVFISDEALTYVDMLNPDLHPERNEDAENSRRAVECMQRSIAILEGLLKVNPSNRSWRVNLAYERIVVATLQQSHGETHDAAQRASMSVAILKESAADPEATVDTLDRATAGLLTVLPLRLRDTRSTLGFALRLVTAVHRRKADFLLTLAQAYAADGQNDRAGQTAKEALALLPVPAPGAPRSRTYQLLSVAAR